MTSASTSVNPAILRNWHFAEVSHNPTELVSVGSGLLHYEARHEISGCLVQRPASHRDPTGARLGGVAFDHTSNLPLQLSDSGVEVYQHIAAGAEEPVKFAPSSQSVSGRIVSGTQFG